MLLTSDLISSADYFLLPMVQKWWTVIFCADLSLGIIWSSTVELNYFYLCASKKKKEKRVSKVALETFFDCVSKMQMFELGERTQGLFLLVCFHWIDSTFSFLLCGRAKKKQNSLTWLGFWMLSITHVCKQNFLRLNNNKKSLWGGKNYLCFCWQNLFWMHSNNIT